MRAWCATPNRGAAYWLWEEEQEAVRSIERRTQEIERLEAEIVAARTKRDELRLVVVEMRAARDLIEGSGLRVEMRDGMPNISIDKVLADPPQAMKEAAPR